jgi:NADPH:quinone reductase-like Zn-dependent oxidoreductase
VRALVFRTVGDPSVLHVEDVPEPRPPRGDEMLVRVEASSVNGTDLGLRRGDLAVATWGRLPLVPGFDVAGVVELCGPEVTAFAPGDRVMALLGHSGGGQAERTVLRQHRAALVPAALTPEQAAALPLAGLTALQALHRAAALHARPRGARVLVLGASGGIGAYAVQLALLAGARVTGVASGSKLPFVRGLGAVEVVDRRTQDVADDDTRYDVVLDAHGAASFTGLRHLLVEDGVMVSTRAVSRDAVRTLVPPRLRRDGPRFATVRTQPRSQDLSRLGALAARGVIAVPLDRAYPLAEGAAAHRHAEGAATGKVVIRVG